MHVFPRQDGGARRAAHGRGGESVGKMRAALLHDVPGFVHGLHGAWERTARERERESESGGAWVLYEGIEGWRKFKGHGF